MAPRYLDWNGNGSIDPIDIGVSHALDDDRANADVRDAVNSQDPRAQTSGCLSSALIIVSSMVALSLLTFALV